MNKNFSIQEIARGDPQKPQTFYPMKSFVKLEPGDMLAARCTYDTTNSDKVVKIGESSSRVAGVEVSIFIDNFVEHSFLCGFHGSLNKRIASFNGTVKKYFYLNIRI